MPMICTRLGAWVHLWAGKEGVEWIWGHQALRRSLENRLPGIPGCWVGLSLGSRHFLPDE